MNIPLPAFLPDVSFNFFKIKFFEICQVRILSLTDFLLNLSYIPLFLFSLSPFTLFLFNLFNDLVPEAAVRIVWVVLIK